MPDELQLRNPEGYSTMDINRARIQAGDIVTGSPNLLGSAGPAGLLTGGARAARTITQVPNRFRNLVRGLGVTTGLGVAGSEAVDAIQNLASGNSGGNNAIQQIQTPMGGVIPMGGSGIDVNALLGMLGSRTSKKATAELLLYSGALGAIIREPVIFESADGRVRYGSDLGYSLVRKRRQGREIVFQIPTELGRTLGFVRRRKKPVISVRDSNAIRRAARAKDRVYKLAKDSDLCVKKGTRRC
ncbi:MAG: hypothetical protein F4103_13725 [Boseongicola sp. SB0673_bin_14]|nr:hypothetical protein [Boseongicola sp. SB0673_bin_14]